MHVRIQFEDFVRDVRHAVRRLVNKPTATVAAILTLTLATGVAVSMFSLLDRVVFKPLSVPGASRLVVVEQVGGLDGEDSRRTDVVSWESYQQYLEASMSSLDGMAASGDDRSERLSVSLNGGEASGTASGLFVTGNYFRVLGVRPALGRVFASDDDTPAAAPTLILSHRVWRTRFGSDVRTVGQMIQVNGVSVRIVGVAPRSFTSTDLGVAPPDLFFPIMMARRLLGAGGMQSDPQGRRFGAGFPGAVSSPISPISDLKIVGRLKDGVALERAQAEFSSLFGYWGPRRRERSLVPLNQTTLPVESRAEVLQFMTLLAGAAGLTLLIGCANLASLSLARREERRRELAIRAALGCPRARLFRELAVEAGVLACCGGLTGFAFALLLERGFSSFALPGGIAVSSLRTGVDARTLFFTVGMAAVVAFVITLAATWQGSTVHLAHQVEHRGSNRLGGTLWLVGTQVSLSVILVFGAILFVRSVSEAFSTDLGFDSDGLIAVTVHSEDAGNFPVGGSAWRLLEVVADLDDLADLVREIPVVESATVGPMPLLEGSDRDVREVEIDGRSVVLPNLLGISYVGREYFTTLGRNLVRGRDFDSGDTASQPRVGIVSESVARSFWPDGDPLGRRFGLPPLVTESITVVGVVKDAKLKNLRDDSALAVYLLGSQNQLFLGAPLTSFGSVSLILRTSDGERASVLQFLDDAAKTTGLSLAEVTVFDELMRTQLMPQLLGRAILALLGGMGMLLAGAGTYGLVSCVVIRAEAEIALRKALGASVVDAGYFIVKRIFWPLLAGIAAGSALAWWGSSFADRFMYGIDGSDPAMLLSAVAILTIATASVALIPLSRALRINPMEVLRAE